MKRWVKWGVAILLLPLGFYGYRKLIPVYRVEVRSTLVMLGDLDGDHQWGLGDQKRLDDFLKDPFAFSDAFAQRIDLNQNGLLDSEDVSLLRALALQPDPYLAEDAARQADIPFPRPREFYRYEAAGSYISRPLWVLPAPNQVPFFDGIDIQPPRENSRGYAQSLQQQIYNESVHLREAYRKRASGLLPKESAHAREKLTRCQRLLEEGAHYDLLLELMALVEDAETLRASPSAERPIQLLQFRDHLRELLASELFERYREGKAAPQEILQAMEAYLKTDLALDYHLETLSPPRNLTNLQNYLERAEWQYYKTSTRGEDFLQLLNYAQHDARYLRAVARTSRKPGDLGVENHNLPMVLLFREALRIKAGDKKRAVGLLDEAIRIPFAWIKSIPQEKLPRSLALDNFLLPGNKEDGSDKSRHWNVFGGICLYKSPEEALDLALKREMRDLKTGGYSPEAMTEFIRDMIANLNGMYHVMVIDPNLLPAQNEVPKPIPAG